MKPDFKQLAQRMAKGDVSALATLYEQCYPALCYYGLRMVGLHQEVLVEEVVQDFFLKLARQPHQLAGVKKVEAYLYRSIRQNLNQRLSQQRNKRKVHDRYDQRTAPLRAKSTPSAESKLVAAEQQELLQQQLQNAMEQLPPYQREILHLRYFESRDYEEIAELLSISQQVARNYVYRAIRQLRQLMGTGILGLLVQLF
ncbi:MAG: RNA polymerase sigma factor [Bacteroidota bacterium]